MIASLRHFLGWTVSACRSRQDLVLENLALRRQLLALHAQRPLQKLPPLSCRSFDDFEAQAGGFPLEIVDLQLAVLRLNHPKGWPLLVLVTPRTVVNSVLDMELHSHKQPHRFLLLDREVKFGADVVSAVRGIGSEPTRTGFRRPWQNGVAEHWVGSCRRGLLDHVIIRNERHLKRLMSAYLLYDHEDRTHLGLAKDTPAGRLTEIRSECESKVQSFPRLGGLHHRYGMAA